MHIGHLIATLTALAAAGGVALHVVAFRRRWSDRLGGKAMARVRSGVGLLLPSTRLGLQLAADAAREIIDQMWPHCAALYDVRIEVCPAGSLGIDHATGKPRAATWRTERALPFTRIIYVVRTQETLCTALYLHELFQHIAPHALFGDANIGHNWLSGADMNQDALRILERMRAQQ
jgi:hypothetical protein